MIEKRILSLVASGLLLVSSTAAGVETSKNIKANNAYTGNGTSILGWGDPCTPVGLQKFLVSSFPTLDGKDKKEVTVFECKRKDNGGTHWYNDGTIYKDPKFLAK